LKAENFLADLNKKENYNLAIDFVLKKISTGIKGYSIQEMQSLGKIAELINNYSVYSPWNMYSHNDYIESLTSTGIIGFTIYQSVGIITIMRSVKLLYACSDHDNRFYFAMIILGVLLIKIIGLGQIIYAQPSGMIILAVLANWLA